MPSDIDKYVGERLRSQRIQHGLSQQALGEMVGITFQQIQKYEKAANRIAASRLYQFAAILQCPLSGFFPDGEDIDGIAANPSKRTSFHHRQSRQVIEHFNDISDPEHRKLVIALLKSIANPTS